MSTNKILLKFAKKGINLSPEAYDKVMKSDNPLDFASNLIVKLKSDKFTSKDLVCVSGETIDEITGVKAEPENDNQDTLIKPKEENEKTVDKTPQPAKKVSDAKAQPPKKVMDEKPKISGNKEVEAKKPDSIDDLKKQSDKPEHYVNEAIRILKSNSKEMNRRQMSNMTLKSFRTPVKNHTQVVSLKTSFPILKADMKSLLRYCPDDLTLETIQK